MGGYVARAGAATGVLHPLEVGAVAFVGAGGTAVLCVVDLLQVDNGPAVAARCAVATAVGTSPDLVWLCATHTHSGPRPDDVTDQVMGACVAAARSAVAAVTPAAVTLHRGELHGVGDRRTGSSRGGVVPVDVLRVADAGGGLVGLVGVVPVHATVLGAASTLVSPDLPGAVRRSLSAAGVWSLVATGAAGDVSTRDHRREQTGAEVDRLGGLTADALLVAAATPAVATATDVVSGRVAAVELEPADPGAPFRRDALESARRTLAGARATGDSRLVRDATVGLEGAELAAAASEPGAVSCATAYLDLGGVRLLGLGGEPFLDLAPGGTSVLLGCANGYAGYLPTRAAFADATAHPDLPSYEVLVSRVAPGEPERALAAALGG
jgi:hypothetical protein